MAQVLDQQDVTEATRLPTHDKPIENALKYLVQCLNAVRSERDIPENLPGVSIAERIKVRLASQEQADRCWLRDDEDAPCHFLAPDLTGPVDCTNCNGAILEGVDGITQLMEGVRRLAKEAARKSQELQITRELLDTGEELCRLGQQVSAVTHELNNIICSVMGYAQLANLTGEERDVKKLIEVTLEATGRARTIIQGLRTARASGKKMGIQHIPELLDMAVSHVSRDLGKERIVIQRNYSNVPWVITNSLELQRVFLSICSHLATGMGEGGKLELAIEPRGEYIEIRIAGEPSKPSIDPAQLVFDRFFPPAGESDVANVIPDETLRENQEIVSNLGGELKVRRARRSQAVYTVKLPIG